MKKGKTTALILSLAVSLTGCAQGDISRYVAAVQQAGEEFFEGKPAPAVNLEEETMEETKGAAAETKDRTIPTETAPENTTAESAETESTETESIETESTEAESTETESTEAESIETENAETEDAEAGKAETADSNETGSEEPQNRKVLAEASEDLKAVLEEKRGAFSGKLLEEHEVDKAQRSALETVLREQEYDEKSFCLQYEAGTGKAEEGSFLLFADRTALAVYGRLEGDLWFCSVDQAGKLMEDCEFTDVKDITANGMDMLLVCAQNDDGKNAQVYQVKEGNCIARFEGANEIVQTLDGLCAVYENPFFRYDPQKKKWADQQGEIPCFYAMKEDGLVQLPAEELTQEEYLSYFEEGAADIREDFAENQGDDAAYRYTYFSIEESRVGCRESRIGVSKEGTHETDHAVAEYRYTIYELIDGKITRDSEKKNGNGYYFRNWEEREEELEELKETPTALKKSRINRTAQYGVEERAALEAVLQVQEYSKDALAFIRRGDYDMDGTKETFLAVGSYDGCFGAPVCDLWFVKGDQLRLLAENLPLQSMERYALGGQQLLVWEGYDSPAGRDLLFGVEDGEPKRLLDTAYRIQVEENGDLNAWLQKEDGLRPYAFCYENGVMKEYSVQEKELKDLLDYTNGAALQKRLLLLANGQEERISCLYRSNGLWHIMLTDQFGTVSYETYRIQENALVLTDCGIGSYESNAVEADSVGAGGRTDEVTEESAGETAEEESEMDKEDET